MNETLLITDGDAAEIQTEIFGKQFLLTITASVKARDNIHGGTWNASKGGTDPDKLVVELVGWNDQLGVLKHAVKFSDRDGDTPPLYFNFAHNYVAPTHTIHFQIVAAEDENG